MQSEIKLKRSEMYLLSLVSGIAPVIGLGECYQGTTNEELDGLMDEDFESIKEKHYKNGKLSSDLLEVIENIKNAYKIIEIDGLEETTVFFISLNETDRQVLKMRVVNKGSCVFTSLDYDQVFSKATHILRQGMYEFRVYDAKEHSYMEYTVRSYGGNVVFSVGDSSGTSLGEEGIRALIEKDFTEGEEHERKRLH